MKWFQLGLLSAGLLTVVAPSALAGPSQMLPSCDPSTIYVGEEFVYPTRISYSVTITPDWGYKTNPMGGTYVILHYEGPVAGGYLYAAYGILGDYC